MKYVTTNVRGKSIFVSCEEMSTESKCEIVVSLPISAADRSRIMEDKEVLFSVDFP